MNDLLELALTAHGGLARWKSFSRMRAKVAIGGAIWDYKQQPGLLRDVTWEAELHRQHAVCTPFDGVARHSDFTPQRVAILDADGKRIDSRDAPRAHFASHSQASAWDKLDVIYFSHYALWQYLCAPFLYAAPGFITEELTPWEENGETWRRLKIAFPVEGAWHSPEQVAYYGPDGLLRRHDYTVDILGGATGANYADGYRDFQGIQVPTARRIYSHDAAGRKVAEPLLVSIDIAALHFDGAT